MAESGRAELGSVEAGMVELIPLPNNNQTTSQWQFNYLRASKLSDIRLSSAALVDVSGDPGGSVSLNGNGIYLQDSSIVLNQHRGRQVAGTIQVNADLLALSGALPNKDQSLILTENLGTSTGANITVSARQIIAQDGGEILSTTYQNGGRGGNITVNASESLQFFGVSPFDGTRFSGIGAPSFFGGGKGGDITIATRDFWAQNGAGVISRVLGGQGGGNIRITSETISLIGENPVISGNASIISSTFSGGDAGSIEIDTGRIFLQASGAISASTSGKGNAGSVTINARNSIEIDGSGVTLALPSRISTSGQLLPARFRQVFGLPAVPTGNGGNLFINAPSIKVSNQGFIAAENVGRGNAGSLKIQADEIILNNQGQIRTSTEVGQGGILQLNVRSLLLLRNNSLISARAGALGSGGNITIDSPIMVGLENSDIIANAVRGRGGNINVTTQGLIGLSFSNTLTPRIDPNNDITASSEFNVSGNVQVNNIGTDLNVGTTELPVNLADASQKIATGCSSNQGSQFIATGRGGLPQNPNQDVMHDIPWDDLRDLSAYRGSLTSVAPVLETQPPLIQASGFQRNADGSIELIAQSTLPATLIATCSGPSITTAYGT